MPSSCATYPCPPPPPAPVPDSEVYVVDLLALAGRAEGEAALAAALSPVLASDAVYKLGCGVSSDCRKLAAHHPAAFGLVRGCLDLSTAWRSHSIEQSEAAGERQGRLEGGLGVGPKGQDAGQGRPGQGGTA